MKEEEALKIKKAGGKARKKTTKVPSSRSSRGSRENSLSRGMDSSYNNSMDHSLSMGNERSSTYRRSTASQRHLPEDFFKRRQWRSKFKNMAIPESQTLPLNLMNLLSRYDSIDWSYLVDAAALKLHQGMVDEDDIRNISLLYMDIVEFLMQLLVIPNYSLLSLPSSAVDNLRKIIEFQDILRLALKTHSNCMLTHDSNYHQDMEFKDHATVLYLDEAIRLLKFFAISGSISTVNQDFDKLFFQQFNIAQMPEDYRKWIMDNHTKLSDFYEPIRGFQILGQVFASLTGIDKLMTIYADVLQDITIEPKSTLILMLPIIVSGIKVQVSRFHWTYQDYKSSSTLPKFKQILKMLKICESHIVAGTEMAINDLKHSRLNNLEQAECSLAYISTFLLKPYFDMICQLAVDHADVSEYGHMLDKLLEAVIGLIFDMPAGLIAAHMLMREDDVVSYLANLDLSWDFNNIRINNPKIMNLIKKLIEFEVVEAEVPKLAKNTAKLDILCRNMSANILHTELNKSKLLSHYLLNMRHVSVSANLANSLAVKHMKSKGRLDTIKTPHRDTACRSTHVLVNHQLSTELGINNVELMVVGMTYGELRPVAMFISAPLRCSPNIAPTDIDCVAAKYYADWHAHHAKTAGKIPMTTFLQLITSKSFMSKSWKCMLYSLSWTLSELQENGRQEYLKKVIDFVVEELITDQWTFSDSELEPIFELVHFIFLQNLPYMLEFYLSAELELLLEICVLLFEGLLEGAPISKTCYFLDILHTIHQALTQATELTQDGDCSILHFPVHCHRCRSFTANTHTYTHKRPSAITCPTCAALIHGHRVVWRVSDSVLVKAKASQVMRRFVDIVAIAVKCERVDGGRLEGLNREYFEYVREMGLHNFTL